MVYFEALSMSYGLAQRDRLESASHNPITTYILVIKAAQALFQHPKGQANSRVDPALLAKATGHQLKWSEHARVNSNTERRTEFRGLDGSQ